MIPYFQFEKIQIGPITIYTWGIFLVLAFLFAFFYVFKKVKKQGIDQNIIINAFSWLIVGTIIGARLGYVLQYFDYYFSKPVEILKIWQGGLTFYGGLFGLLAAAIIYARITKLSLGQFLRIADIAALGAPLAIAIGRIGCSLINDHMGKETFLGWGILWQDGIIRHPVAEYLIISNLIIFLILRFLSKKIKRPGEIFLAFLFFYSFSRFFLDFSRAGDPSYYGLSTPQWLSLALISGIIIKKFVKFLKKNKKVEY